MSIKNKRKYIATSDGYKAILNINGDLHMFWAWIRPENVAYIGFYVFYVGRFKNVF